MNILFIGAGVCIVALGLFFERRRRLYFREYCQRHSVASKYIKSNAVFLIKRRV